LLDNPSIAVPRRADNSSRQDVQQSDLDKDKTLAKLEGFVGAHSALPMTNWQAVRTSFGRLQQAFGLKP
jgi:hypothetical protein